MGFVTQPSLGDLWPCAPPFGAVMRARCWETRPNPASAVPGLVLLSKHCKRGACPCPVCVEGDAMVRSYNERHAA